MEREPDRSRDHETPRRSSLARMGAASSRRRWGSPASVLLALLLVACPGPAGEGDPSDQEVTGTVRTEPDGITGSRELEIILSEVTGATRMRFAEHPVDLQQVEWQPFSPQLPWLLSEGDGTKILDGELANDAGGYLRVEVRVRLIEHPPRGSFSINGGSTHTDRPEVELNLEGISGADQMRFSLTPSELPGLPWVDFGPKQDFLLGEEEGAYTVFGEFRDDLGRVLAQDASITLMVSAPGGSFSIDGGATHTNDPQGRVLLDFSRITNAVALRVANETGDLQSENFVEMVDSLAWTLSPGEGGKVVRAEFRSPLGLTNTTSAQIVYDLTPPPAPVITAPARTGNRRPTWSYEAEGATRFRVRLSDENDASETTEASFTPEVALGACNRDYALTVAAGDPAGNWSPEASSTIYVYCVVSGSVAEHAPGGGDLFIVLLNEQEYATTEVDPETNRWAVVPATEAVFRFDDIPDGEWILLGFQDDDGNGELTTGLFGAPVEPWGTYAGESWASLIDFSEGHFVIAGDGVSGCVLRLSGFTL